ncbi:MAG: hypothetical protein ACI8S6_002867 [Myxococcota bacterium]|jgi:hypothetical protein
MSRVASRAAQQAQFHARLRWAGAPLLFSGVLLLGWAVVTLLQGGHVGLVLLGMFGTGLGLASFGANHDTALALALTAREQGGEEAGLTDTLTAELVEELEVDRAEVLSLRPSPRIAMVIPMVALTVQCIVLWRLASGVL